jgi:hypothetical protein
VSVIKTVVVLALLLVTSCDPAGGPPVKLGRISSVAYTDDAGGYTAHITTRNGGVYEMDGFRAWKCHDGGVLWQSPSGLIYC